MTAIPPELSSLATALAPDFEVEREIGRGGMGIVYLARDVRLDRPVAIKVLPPGLAGVEQVRERFLREARTAARLSHPNVLSIYRADEMHGVVFFVMAYVDGESLADRIRARGALPALEVARLMRDVALALDYAHARGIVHRDVKPENILIERGTDRPLVTDFGIARLSEAAPLTATGQVLGTVHFMSPEQVAGERLDGRSDLYSLGVVGFLAASGRLPFVHETASAVLVAHVTKPAPSLRDVAPAVPPALATIVDGCLAKDPNARYRTGAALAQALDDAQRAMARDPAGSVAAPPVISEHEAQALWARAAELQERGDEGGVATSPPRPRLGGEREPRSLTQGYRLTEVRDAAVEAGISSRHVERAAAELGLAPAPAPTSEQHPDALTDLATSASAWAGAPLGIGYELQVVGEVPEADFLLLVEIVRQQLGDAGHVATIGRSVSWSSSNQKRRVQVSIIPRGGRTTIRVSERLGPLCGALFGGIIGGGGGGSSGIAFGVGMGVFHSALAACGVLGATLTGTYLLARTIYRAQTRSRREELRTLVERLAMQARDSSRVLPLMP